MAQDTMAPPAGWDDIGHAPSDIPVGKTAADLPPPGWDEGIQEDLQEEKYGGLGQQALAGLEGAARGLSLGAYDALAPKTGLTTAEDIAGRRDVNPVTSAVGNIAGGAGLVGLTGGLAAPVEGALVARGLTGLAPRALGYAAEGGLFGAANTVTEAALGDSKLNAQKLLADVGTGALFGGIAGAGAKKLEGILSKRLADVAAKANSKAETAGALADEATGGLGAWTKPLGSLKPDAKEIEDAAELIGAPLDRAALSDNKFVEMARDALNSGAPTYSAIRQENKIRDGYKAVVKTINEVLDTGDDLNKLTANQLGKTMQESLATKIKSASDPLEKMYESLSQQMETIPLSKKDLPSVSKEILGLDAVRHSPSSPEARIARRVAKEISNLESVNDVKAYKTILNRSVSPTASPGEKHIMGVLADKLTQLEESSIIKAAEDASAVPEMKSMMLGLIDERKAANELYKPFRKNLNALTEQLGKKNAGGAQTAINFIQDLDPEALAQKLFDKKYAGFNKFFAESFPEESALMRQYQKQILKDRATTQGVLSPAKLFTAIDKLEPEIKNAIFAADELAKIKAAALFTRKALPKNFNPSGTSGMSAFRALFESPAAFALGNARDFGIEAFIKAQSLLPKSIRPNPIELGAELANKLNKFQAVEEIAKQADENLSKSVSSIFSKKDALRGGVISAATVSDRSYDRASKDVSELANNPEAIVDHMAAQVGDIDRELPEITQGVHDSAIAALSFLNSNMPKPKYNFPGQKTSDFQPNPIEKATFMRYYNAVNDPFSVLKDVADGVLTKESLEALEMVHPELLAEMRSKVKAKMGKKNPQKLPYMVKISLSKFLGEPLDASMTPAAIQANQAALSGPQLSNQQAAPSGRNANMAKLDLSGRAATITRTAEEDND